MFDRVIKNTVTMLGVGLCLYTLMAVNYSYLQPQSAIALFVGIGLVLCFLVYPIDDRWKDVRWLRYVDVLLAMLAGACCLYIFVQTEPWDVFKQFWPTDKPLGVRPAETRLDLCVGLIGLTLVFEATRRSIGWIVPALALCFVIHCYYCYFTKEHNEEQFVIMSGEPTGGSFTLSYGGEATPPLNFDCSTGDIQNGLRGLSTIGGRNVAVSSLEVGRWKVQFRQDFDAQNVPMMQADASSLTGGTPRVHIFEYTRGSPPILPRPPAWMLPHNGKNV